MLAAEYQVNREVLLLGCESVGKTTFFRQLTGEENAVSSYVKGSTVEMLSAAVRGTDLVLVDAPGLRVEGDAYSMQLTLEQAKQAERMVLFVSSASLKQELILLADLLPLKQRKAVLVVTHTDRYMPSEEDRSYVENLLGISVLWKDTRQIKEEQEELLRLMDNAKTWKVPESVLSFLPEAKKKPPSMLRAFSIPMVGKLLALLFCLALFAVPVFIAYVLADWLQPLVDAYMLDPLTVALSELPPLLLAVLVGDYGLMTLGSYSFIWAFPVIVLVTIATVITEESGLQEHVTYALDGWLRKIGLTGRDLVPVLTGFGCNVVAVLQSRSCSVCSRGACVSLLSFGSACSYQIGATLSLFGAAGKPMLFLPYLFLLFAVGAIHTRMWNKQAVPQLERTAPLPYLQKPDMVNTAAQIKRVIRQFIMQAMPIFLLICLAASLLQFTPVFQWLGTVLSPLLQILQLPQGTVEGLVFSFIRKDGLLVLNQDGGALIGSLSAAQIFILVYLASTLSPCMVTLYTIAREFSIKHASSIFAKQAFTSIVSTVIIAAALYTFFE
jgi:ferrous iron transport protein B